MDSKRKSGGKHVEGCFNESSRRHKCPRKISPYVLMEGYMKFSDDITKCRCYGDRMRRVCSKTLNIGSNSFVFKEAFTTFFTELQCIRKGQQDPTDALSQNIT